MKGCDVIVQGLEQLPTTYRNMIHGQFIGKPIVQLWPDVLATVFDPDAVVEED